MNENTTSSPVQPTPSADPVNRITLTQHETRCLLAWKQQKDPLFSQLRKIEAITGRALLGSVQRSKNKDSHWTLSKDFTQLAAAIEVPNNA